MGGNNCGHDPPLEWNDSQTVCHVMTTPTGTCVHPVHVQKVSIQLLQRIRLDNSCHKPIFLWGGSSMLPDRQEVAILIHPA
jgi:hypothetical protein